MSRTCSMSPLRIPRDAACKRSSPPPVVHDANHDDPGSTSISSWKNIFAIDHGSVPQLGINFVRASQDVATVKYSLANTRSQGLAGDGPVEHATLTLGQDLRNLGLGAAVWDCGENLATFLGRHRYLVAGKRVLDLGAGTGVAGLAAAQCGARDVVLTDHHALAHLVRSNVERNSGTFSAPGCPRVTFVSFSWDDHTAEEARELSSPEFDIVLASDCLYDSAMFAAFRRALAATCGPGTILLMAYKRRLDSREKDFFAQLEDDFDLELVDPRSCEPLTVSNDLEGRKAGGKSAINRKRGVYLLLGVRRRHRCTEDRSSPLDECGIPIVDTENQAVERQH